MADRTGGFGGKLRAARERRGISLREIANKTKISVAVLEALERNDVSRLPGGIFGRGFVRSYAIEVGLDPDETIDAFLAQFPHDGPVSAGHARTEAIEDGEALESDRRLATTLLRLLAISVPLIGVVLYFSNGFHGSNPVPSSAEAPSPPSQPPAPVSLSPPIPEPRPAAAEPAPPEPTAAPAATPDVLPASKPASAAAAPVDRLTIELTASGPCWVEIVADGVRSPGTLMQPGDHRTLDVRRDVVLKAGDAGAISMTVNGAAAKPLGTTGEVVTVHLNLTNFKDHLATP